MIIILPFGVNTDYIRFEILIYSPLIREFYLGFVSQYRYLQDLN